MKKVIVLFIITILLSGCGTDLEKEKQYNKKEKKNIEVCLEGESCNFLEKADKRFENIQDKESIDNNQGNNENTNNIVGVEQGNEIINNQGTEEENNEEENNEEENNEDIDNQDTNNEEENNEEEVNNENNNQTYLAFGDVIDNTIAILFNSVEDIAGFQFFISSDNNIIATNAFGGISETSNIDVMVGEGTNVVLGISLEGNIISEDSGVLTNLEFDNLDIQGAEICISDIVISGVNGDNLNTIEQFCINI